MVEVATQRPGESFEDYLRRIGWKGIATTARIRSGDITVTPRTEDEQQALRTQAEDVRLMSQYQTEPGEYDLVRMMAAAVNEPKLKEVALRNFESDDVKYAETAAKPPVLFKDYRKMTSEQKKYVRPVRDVPFDEYARMSHFEKLFVRNVEPTKVSKRAFDMLGPATKPYAEPKLTTAQKVSGFATELLPFSQFYIPGRLDSYKEKGALGYTALAAHTLLDITLVGGLVGAISKVGGAALARLTPGGKIGALGGRDSLKSLVVQADKKVLDVIKEVATQKQLVRTTEKGLAQAIKRKSPDVPLRKEALALVKQELKTTIAEHPSRVATAKLNLAQLKELQSIAKKHPTKTAAQEKAYLASEKSATIAAKVTPITLRAYGMTELGLTAKQWNELSNFERAMGIGFGSLALGIPQSVLGRLKSGAEVSFSPGRIPHRTIAVPESYIIGEMGMPKTTVRGLPKKRQVKAMEISADAMEKLWQGKGRVFMLWPTMRGNKLVYAPRSEFQKVVPRAMISATPAGEVFNRPIYAVITVREPAQYFAAWGFPKFTIQSAAGLGGGRPAYLVLFSERIEQFPRRIRRAATAELMQKRVEIFFGTGKAKPGTYPGYKLFRQSKEPEFVVPTGAEIGQVEGGLKLWTRASPFGTRIDIQPHFVLAQPSARRTGFTAAEALALKKQGVPAEIRHYIEAAQFWKRGIAGEAGLISRYEARLRSLVRDEARVTNTLNELRAKGASTRRIKRAETKLNGIQYTRMEIQARLQFERALHRMKTSAEIRRTLFENMTKRMVANTIKRVERARDAVIRSIRTSQRFRDRMTRELRTPPRPDRPDRPPRDERPTRDDRPPRDERVARDERVTRDDRPPRDERVTRPDRPDRPPREERPPRPPREPRVPRPPRADKPPIKKKPPIPPGDGLKIERVEGVPENPGVIDWEKGIVKVEIHPPYREGREDLHFELLDEPRKGKGSQERTLRVRDGDAPDLIVLSRTGGIAKTHILKGKKMRHIGQKARRQSRGPGLLKVGGAVQRQRRGSVI